MSFRFIFVSFLLISSIRSYGQANDVPFYEEAYRYLNDSIVKQKLVDARTLAQNCKSQVTGVKLKFSNELQVAGKFIEINHGFPFCDDRFKNEKATVIKKSFITMDNSWGDLIRNLRDKVLHYDLIKTNHEYRPKLRGKSYEEFAQHLTNNMFDFLIDLNYLLFEVEWVSGTFDEFKRKYDR